MELFFLFMFFAVTVYNHFIHKSVPSFIIIPGD